MLDKCILLRIGALTGCRQAVQGKSPGAPVQVKEPFGNLDMVRPKKNMCVYYLMKISNRVGRSIFLFFFF